MNNSKDARAQEFLETMREMDFEKYEILQLSRQIVFDTATDTQERFIYGGIMFTVKGQDFGGVFASKKHVSFEFTKGFEFKDADNILEGSGKFRRHLKLRTKEDVSTKNVAGFVQQSML